MAKLRRDVSILAKGKQEVGLVNNMPDEPAKRPTIFVSALIDNDKDKRWFYEVVALMMQIEVPA